MKIILWDVEKERNKLSKRNLYLILKEIRNLSFSHLKKNCLNYSKRMEKIVYYDKNLLNLRVKKKLQLNSSIKYS